ncbi:MAG: hypothetical protein KDD82_24535, partial [Planctomycetes bacterium]|nr:hypothetical protein [Planctomycetota bacterium]
GIAWAALAVDQALQASDAAEGLLTRCFAALAAEGGGAVVEAARRLGLAGEPTKGLTPSTRGLLAREAQRAEGLARAACAGRGAWSALCFPTPEPGGPAVWVRPEGAEPGYAEGQVLGLAQRLIAALEASGASVRPYPQRVARGWAFAVDALGPAQAHAAAKVLRVSDALRVECDPPV